MKIAVISAGGGQKADYTWKSNSVSECGERIRVLENMCGQGHGCALVRHSADAFDLYFSGFRSVLADCQNRSIFVAVAFLGVPEITARALVLLFMEDYDSFKQTLLDSFSRPSADEWTVDYGKISGIAGEAESRANLNPQAIPFDQPRADYFDDKEDGPRSRENIKQLCREIRNHCFSGGDGLKLLVAATSPQAGYDKALEEADRFLSKDDLVTFRKKKESLGANPTPSQKSSTPSSPSSKRLGLIEFLFLEKSSSPSAPPVISVKKLSIICGCIVLAAVLMAKCRKKAVPNPPPPVQTAPSAPYQGQAAEPLPTDEQQESAPAPPVDGDPAPQ